MTTNYGAASLVAKFISSKTPDTERQTDKQHGTLLGLKMGDIHNIRQNLQNTLLRTTGARNLIQELALLQI